MTAESIAHAGFASARCVRSMKDATRVDEADGGTNLTLGKIALQVTLIWVGKLKVQCTL